MRCTELDTPALKYRYVGTSQHVRDLTAGLELDATNLLDDLGGQHAGEPEAES